MQKQATNQNGFAVVELFTSEGCSSCPPADEAVANLLKDYTQNVYVLGFHVDYWNSFGWKDAFSNGAYSSRQQQYGNVFKLNSIYTPQAIVNGKTEFTGSDTKRLQTSVEEGLLQKQGLKVDVSAKSGDGKTVTVTYQLNQPSSNLLNIALVQLQAQSQVQRGENSGKLLLHVNVVRDFKTIAVGEAKGIISLTLPAGTDVKDFEVIAYLQDAHLLRVMAATSTVIE